MFCGPSVFLHVYSFAYLGSRARAPLFRGACTTCRLSWVDGVSAGGVFSCAIYAPTSFFCPGVGAQEAKGVATALHLGPPMTHLVLFLITTA